MANAIESDNLTRSFGRKKVLDRVSLAVPTGGVFALLGENGAGKTTLIRTLLGYHRPQSGSVSVLGLDPARRPLDVRRKVGYVSDSHDQYEWMTVGETGWFASGFYPAGFAERYAGLTAGYELPRETRLKHLSRGMRAQVSLSLALSADPELLILDEPTSGLDPLVRRTFLESMIDRAASGRTVFLSSHQIAEVERVADHVAILADGKIRLAAPLDELKSTIGRLSVTLRDPLLALPSAVGSLEILAASQSGRAWNLLARGDGARVEAECRDEPNVLDADWVRPTLEEIYIALAGSSRTDVPIGTERVPAIVGG